MDKTTAALKVLAEWLEEAPLPDLLRREAPAMRLEDRNEILAIVGPRRAGKTFFMYQLIQDLLRGGRRTKKDILFVDFEDYRLADFRAVDTEVLLSAFVQLTGHRPTFLFLDEIQRLEGWSRVLRTLHNRGSYRIIVSGSNAKLLGREIATELRGRYRDAVILPFSFLEWSRLKGVPLSPSAPHTSARGALRGAFEEYARNGGFPEVARMKSVPEKRKVLQGYYQTIYYRDILERYQIKARAVLDALMTYCLNTYGELLSISAVERSLKQRGLAGSKRTLANYVRYLEEAFFVITHEKFSYSPKGRLANPRKVYLLDTGFAHLATDFSENRGKTLENMVAIELFRRQEACFYFKGRRECDFIVKRGTRPALAIQACWELTPRNEERELKGLLEAMRACDIREGIVLTFDQSESRKIDGKTLRVQPAWEWMLKLSEGL